MNRNRFTTPPPPYNIENKINPLNFPPPIPRFNVWQQPLPPLPPNQNLQATYSLPQPKKNYCSTCDLWTVEPYNNHQVSPAHMAKKASLRTNQIYQPLFPSIINNPSNNIINSINTATSTTTTTNNNNNNSNKKKFKRISKRNNQNNNNKQLTNDLSEPNESNSIDGLNMIPGEQCEDKSQLPNTGNTRKKGQEMLIPVNGMFCALCEMFFPDKEVAENEHCSSEEHCDAYEKLLKKIQESTIDKRPLNNSNTSDDIDSLNVEAKRPKISQENQDRDFRQIPIDRLKSPDSRVPIMAPLESGVLPLTSSIYSMGNNIVTTPVVSTVPLMPAPPREPAPPVPREPPPPIPREPASPVLEEPVVMTASIPVISSTSCTITSTITSSSNSTVTSTTSTSIISSSAPVTTGNSTTVNVSISEADRSSATDCQAPDFSLEFPDDMEDYDEGEIISEPES